VKGIRERGHISLKKTHKIQPQWDLEYIYLFFFKKKKKKKKKKKRKEKRERWGVPLAYPVRHVQSG
jgi:hypothetical protein